MTSIDFTTSDYHCDLILERLGLSYKPEVNIHGLTKLYQAWCQKIPFDNLLKRIIMATNSQSALPGLSPADFFGNWLNFGVGGTCWATQGALNSLLKKLDFPVNYALSTMLSPGNENSVTPGHGTLIVNIGSGPLIVDPTMLHREPLQLTEHEFVHPVWGTHVHYTKNYWCINWKPLGRPRVDCRLLNMCASVKDFISLHQMSRDTSHFNSATLVRAARGDSIVGLVKGKKIIRGRDGVETREELNHSQQVELLIDEFKINERIALQMPRA